MKKYLFSAILLAACSFITRGEITVEDCLNAAHDNYPLIKKYDLLSSTENIQLSDITKGWLPKIGVYGQGTIQNVVPSFPDALSNMMHQAGGNIKGLGKFQYKVGIDLNQTIWDGGASRRQREIARQSTITDRESLNVEMYGIRQRVESIYFAILLLQSQIEHIESSIHVYEANLSRLRSMFANGTAMQSDVDMVEAQILSVRQQLVSAVSSLMGYRKVLSIFTGLNLENEKLVVPDSEIPTDLSVNRPELEMFNAQETLNNLRKNSITTSLMPKIGLFAQSYYGYPGIDYFKAMMKRDLTFNILAGIKVSWNIDAFYTKNNSLRRIDIANQQIESQRETFMLNNSMQSASQIEAIRGIEAVMADDAKIIELRKNVRLAAESQLRNGLIDVTALTSKINDETQAALNASYHSIQHIQAIYNLKNTLNR